MNITTFIQQGHLRFLFIFLFPLQLMSNPTREPELLYLVRQPLIHTSQPPLLILLHGVGSNEADLFSLANQIPGEFMVVSARGPIVLGPNSFGWYRVDFSTGKPVYNHSQEVESRNTIIRFISQIKSKFKLDSSKVYLCGFSQGAIMSYSVALLHPHMVNGFAALSGRMLNEIKPFIKSTSSLEQLRIFISHGTLDQTLSVNYAKEANAFLLNKGLVPQFHVYPAAHTLTDEMLRDLIAWCKALLH